MRSLCGQVLLGFLLGFFFLSGKIWAKQLEIVATVFPLYELARELAPEANIHLLIPPGRDIHHFEPRYKDFRTLHSADLILAVGVEPWLKGKLSSKALVLTQAREIRDPHVWLDLKRLAKYLETLSRKLCERDSSRCSFYRKREKQLKGRLESLRKEFRRLRECRFQLVVLLGHASLGYLLREAGLQEVALSGPHPEGEVPPQRLARVLKLVKSQNLPVVFVLEPSFEKYARLFQEKTGVKILPLNPGIPLFPEDQGLSFWELLQKDLDNLRAGLCS